LRTAACITTPWHEEILWVANIHAASRLWTRPNVGRDEIGRPLSLAFIVQCGRPLRSIAGTDTPAQPKESSHAESASYGKNQSKKNWRRVFISNSP
jgi:hypothetical protein